MIKCFEARPRARCDDWHSCAMKLGRPHPRASATRLEVRQAIGKAQAGPIRSTNLDSGGCEPKLWD